MLSGGIVLALNKFTFLPRNLLTENATQVGSALGVILLSLALADRLNREKKRAFAAQQKLLREERKARLAQEKSCGFRGRLTPCWRSGFRNVPGIWKP